MVISIERLSTEFRDWLITNSGLTWNSPTGDWTTGIKQFFNALGSQQGFEVVFTRRGVSEYLLDLVWMQRSPRKFIQLGLESEMSHNQTRRTRAFEKLTDTKAYYKIGIFRVGLRSANQLLSRFRRILNDHTIPISQERYLAISLSYDSTQNRIGIGSYLLQPDSSYDELEDAHYLFPE